MASGLYQNNQTDKSACSNFIQRADLFAEPVKFSFKGRKRISSSLGVCASIMVFAAILGFSIFKIQTLVNMSDFKISSSEILNPFNYTKPEAIQYNDLGFDFAFGMYYPLPANIGAVTINYGDVHYETNLTTNATKRIATSRPIEMALCGETGFNYSDPAEIKRKGIANYMCVKNKTEFLFQGTFESQEYKYMTIKVKPCINTTANNNSCATKEA